MHVVHIISSLERGGAQAVLYDIVQGLAKRDYQQSIIYLHGGPYVDAFAASGIPMYQIKGFVSPFDPIAINNLYVLLQKINPSLVHTVLWAANWMGRIVTQRLKIPCIAALHNNYEQNGWVRNFLDRIVPFSNEAIIAVSEEVKASFYQWQKTTSPCIVIRNGIDNKAFQQQLPLSRDALGLQADHFIIGSVGRFAPIKRYPLLLEAFALLYTKYSQARLLLIGGGPQEKMLRAQAQQLGIIDAIRWVMNKPAAPYYGLMDCFVLASEREGISIALLEAMSCNVACVVTYATTQHPVLENMHTGIVVCPSNATLLYQNMRILITNNSIRKQLAKNAQQLVENDFNCHRMVNAYDRLFHAYCMQKSLDK